MSCAELAVSASGPRLLAALRIDDGRVVVSDSDTSGRGTDLALVVDALCRSCRIQPTALSAIRVDIGPGSYTGLRVATTFARTVAAFTGAALDEFTSLELIACAAWLRGDADPERDVIVALDARRRRFHVGRLRLHDGRVRVVEPGPAAVDAAGLIAHLDTDATIVAEPALHDALRAGRDPSDAPRIAWPVPTATDLFDASLAPRAVAPDAIAPLYLMATYADD